MLYFPEKGAAETESRKKNVFICLYIALWLAEAWMSFDFGKPVPAVVLAVIYVLVLTEKKPGRYILYCWCGLLACFYGFLLAGDARNNILYGEMYMTRPLFSGAVLWLALMLASIVLTVLFQKVREGAEAEKNREKAEKRKRRLEAKTQRDGKSRGKGGSA